MIQTGMSQIPRVRNRNSALQDATVREFGGGWNVVDNELNLSTRFATVLDNMSRDEDGSMSVRWGTQLLADVRDAGYIAPGDITFNPFNSHAQVASAGVLANPNAWHDAALDQTLAQSTNTTYFRNAQNDPDTVSLTVSGTYSSLQNIDTLSARRPTDGWTSDDAGRQITLRHQYRISGEADWTTVREQTYPDASVAPDRFYFTVAGNPISEESEFQFTISTPVDRGDTVTIGVAEFSAGEYTGAGDANEAHIVNHFYFQDSIIVVLSNGVILRTAGDGTISVIWDLTIASGLIGSPAPWGPTDFASFAVFNGKLIVCNGTDKPLIMDFNNDPPVQYLADESTGSNVNVPICRYVVAMNTYLVMAGDPLFPDRVHISNQNTSGTWFGDPAPNDGTYVDLGKVGVQGEQVITGVNRYRDQLVVGFFSASVLGKLGIYDNGSPPVHTPDFNDVIEGFGCHAHRSMVNLGNDLFMLDDQGITSIARSLYSGSTEPKRVSELIDPEINANVNRLREADTILGAHGVYNSNDKQYMCFVPNHSEYSRNAMTDPFEVLADRNNALRMHIPNHRFEVNDRIEIVGATAYNDITEDQLNQVHTITRVINEDIFEIEPADMVTDPNKEIIGGGGAVQWTPQWTETYGYIYTFVNELKVRAWARFRDWKWRSSARTELGTVVFADDNRLFVLGNQNNPLHEDFIGTTDQRGIAWQWELPWADFDQRVNEKHTRYIQLDTAGTASFTMMMFVDQLYMLNGLLIPNNLMTFVGGDNGGYGNNGQPYGGGRRTADQRLYAWPARGKLFKLRFQGITLEPLRVVAVSLMYLNGSIRR